VALAQGANNGDGDRIRFSWDSPPIPYRGHAKTPKVAITGGTVPRGANFV